MIPLSRTPVWSPVEALVDLDVTVANPAGAGQRVELVDKRVWMELVSLTPAEAGALSIVLAERARWAGWVDPGDRT
jgi:hypothetical protein